MRTDPPAFPICFDVIPKARVWGGQSLHRIYGKPLPTDGSPCGETWEVVDLAEDQSRVRAGPLAGAFLSEILQRHESWLMGRAALMDGRFPLLLKLIDARSTLSVQVHPDAESAARLHGRPKTEAWVILSAIPDACLFLGLRQGVTQVEMSEAAGSSAVEALLNRVFVSEGDVVFIPAGTVHAIGAGIVLAELQQASDTTYRLHDWGRLGLDGSPRQLHIAEALQSIHFESKERLFFPGSPTGRVVDCPAFCLELQLLKADTSYYYHHDHPLIVMSLQGHLRVEAGKGSLLVEPGWTALCPAASEDTVIMAAQAPARALVGWPK